MTRQRPGWILCLALFAAASPFGPRARGDEEKVEKPEKTQKESKKSVLEFKVKDIDGQDVALEKYRGQVLMVVNVASQ